MLSKNEISKLVKKSTYWNNGKTTVCILTLQSGFEIVGTSSVLDRSDFDEEIGKEFAWKNATDKLIEFEAYKAQAGMKKTQRTKAENQEYLSELLKCVGYFHVESNSIDGLTFIEFDMDCLTEGVKSRLREIPVDHCKVILTAKR